MIKIASKTPVWFIIALFIAILLFFSLSSCYTLPKAKAQFGKAVIAHPEIGADYCARTYKGDDSVAVGVETIRTDTIWASDGTVTIVRDTMRSRDTVFIKTIQQLPGTVITRTITRTDTVYIENNAAIDLCNIERRAAVLAMETEQKRADKYKVRAKKYLLILIGLGALVALGMFLRLRKKSTK